MIRERAVTVRHFPETFAGKQISDFFSEIKRCLDVDNRASTPGPLDSPARSAVKRGRKYSHFARGCAFG
jgi:hypothetical protein